MTTCTDTTGANAPSHPFTSAWVVDGLFKRGELTQLTGERLAGKRRLLGYLLANMLAVPAGGPVLRAVDVDGPVLSHNGFTRMLYCCGDERSNTVQTRLNDYARAAGHDPRPDWSIEYADIAGLRIRSEKDRQDFARELLEPGRYDMMIVDPQWIARVATRSDSFILLRFLRRWTEHYGLTTIVLGTYTEVPNLPATVNARLTLDRVSLVDGKCVLCREPSLPALPDLRLVDLGDPHGFRVVE